MFTGIVETIGKVVKIEKEKDNVHFTIEAPFADEVKIDQSIAHDGVCLTTVKADKENKQWVVTAIKETLERSNLRTWEVGCKVNLERCLKVDGRLDGHIVQGHVDQTAVCTKVEEVNGSWYFYFEYNKGTNNITVEKGSICINGVSLTVVDSGSNTFSVAIIPYTYNETNFHTFKKGSVVNIEFDIVGKYIAKMISEGLISINK